MNYREARERRRNKRDGRIRWNLGPGTVYLNGIEIGTTANATFIPRHEAEHWVVYTLVPSRAYVSYVLTNSDFHLTDENS